MKLKTKEFNLALARSKLTVQELANQAKIPKQTIHRLKNPKGNNKVLPRTIGKLAEVLGVDVKEICSSI